MLIKSIEVAYETDQHRTVLELYIKTKLTEVNFLMYLVWSKTSNTFN